MFLLVYLIQKPNPGGETRLESLGGVPKGVTFHVIHLRGSVFFREKKAPILSVIWMLPCLMSMLYITIPIYDVLSGFTSIEKNCRFCRFSITASKSSNFEQFVWWLWTKNMPVIYRHFECVQELMYCVGTLRPNRYFFGFFFKLPIFTFLIWEC